MKPGYGSIAAGGTMLVIALPLNTIVKWLL